MVTTMENRSFFWASVIALLWLLSACAASGPKLGEPDGTLPRLGPGQARMVFYRDDNPFLLALEPQIVVNSLAVGRSLFGAVFYKDARPGRYKVFLATDEENPVYLILRAGETAYIKVVPELKVPGSKLTAYQIAPAQGQTETQGLALNNGLGE